jgi:hypothetical protein
MPGDVSGGSYQVRVVIGEQVLRLKTLFLTAAPIIKSP